MKRVLITTVVALTIAALAGSTEINTVRAAPPEVKASENPVAFACPVRQGTTKVITLTWSVVAGTQLPSLVVTEGAQTVLSQQFITPPSSGAVPLTVAYGKTYVAQLKDVLSQPLGPPLIITTTCAGSGGTIPFDPGLACIVIRCNTVTVTPEPHGTFATFAVTATNDSSFQLQVSRKTNGQCGPVEKSAFNLVKGLTWNPSPTIFDLDAGTAYCHTVIATDTMGVQTTMKGEFSTRARRVKVHFASIWVTGAEEDIFSGDPDPFFWWRVNGACAGMSDYWSQEIALLETVQPNVEVTINNAPATLMLGVLGVDDDTFGAGKPFLAANCSDQNMALGDWSSATGSYYVGWTMVDPTEEFQKSFLLNANNGDFKFQVTGTYTVSYP